jgi:nucleotide-binding universal stress UspA family protein
MLMSRAESFMSAAKKILVPVDFGEASEAALLYGRNFARAFGAELHILHVTENLFLRAVASDPSAIEAGMARRLAGYLSEDDRQMLRAVAVVLISNDFPAEIVRYARDEGIGLIVMGTHGRVKTARLMMGSVAEKVVRTAPCPVMTVRHPEHEFVHPDPPEAQHDRA